jgi:hypothetical protein
VSPQAARRVCRLGVILWRLAQLFRDAGPQQPGFLDPKQLAALASDRCFGGADVGIIMARFVRLRFAAVAMIAAAIIAATTASGWAFSQQTISPDANGNYNFNYTDPNHQPSTSQSAHPSESNGLGFHFSVEHGQAGPFGGF